MPRNWKTANELLYSLATPRGRTVVRFDRNLMWAHYNSFEKKRVCDALKILI